MKLNTLLHSILVGIILIACGENQLENSSSTKPKNGRNLSENGTSNCYIVSSPGLYKFVPVKGNSSTPVGEIASVNVLWETFGTDIAPTIGSLIKNVKLNKNYIYFTIPSDYKTGNALIGALNSDGEILWSWHIWITDIPKSQTYYNNAGTVMDRNLGATSATPGDVRSLGLLYQWGRKDPFIGSGSIEIDSQAKSTIIWPDAVSSDYNTGSIEFATANPTTFIKGSNWFSASGTDDNNSLWLSDKTIYDPCPVGWRVPDGSQGGLWARAVGSVKSFQCAFDDVNKGMDFSYIFGDDDVIWYPAAGEIYGHDSSLSYTGRFGHYWSVNPRKDLAFLCDFDYRNTVNPGSYDGRAAALSVRCVQE